MRRAAFYDNLTAGCVALGLVPSAENSMTLIQALANVAAALAAYLLYALLNAERF